MSPRTRLRSPLLPLLVGLALAMQLFDPYRGWVVLLVLLGGAWLVSWLWVRSLAKHLRLKREIRFGWAQVGDRLEEQFTLDNPGWAPALWVEVMDRSTLPGYQVNRATAVDGQSYTRWRTEGECRRRGLFTLGPTRISTSDPFGIYYLELQDAASRTLLVMPPIVPLPGISVAPGGRTGEGRPRPDAPERVVSAASVREYVPGDSLRHIHWRTTARHNKPFVRIFDGTPAADWRILVDLDASIQVGEGDHSTLEHSIILAASLADQRLRQRKAVGMVINGEKLDWLLPEQGEGQRWAILRLLALANPGQVPLQRLLASIDPELPAHTSLVIITASARLDWLEGLLPLVWRGVIPTVLLLDPQTFGGNDSLQPSLSQLTRLGINHSAIPRQLLDLPEAHPGQAGSWEWRVSPSGRAVPVRKPTDMTWRTLS